MQNNEKITILKQLLSPETPSIDELNTLLNLTKLVILNRRYPNGFPLLAEVPENYEGVQLQCCVALYNKRGAEGQLSHSENGITRTYEKGDIPESLLKQITPLVGSVKVGVFK